MAKVNISIADDLLSRLDTEAKSNYVSRSGMLAMMISSYFRSKDTLESVDKLVEALQEFKA